MILHYQRLSRVSKLMFVLYICSYQHISGAALTVSLRKIPRIYSKLNELGHVPIKESDVVHLAIQAAAECNTHENSGTVITDSEKKVVQKQS